jgi:hypothetical protein
MTFTKKVVHATAGEEIFTVNADSSFNADLKALEMFEQSHNLKYKPGTRMSTYFNKFHISTIF